MGSPSISPASFWSVGSSPVKAGDLSRAHLDDLSPSPEKYMLAGLEAHRATSEVKLAELSMEVARMMVQSAKDEIGQVKADLDTSQAELRAVHGVKVENSRLKAQLNTIDAVKAENKRLNDALEAAHALAATEKGTLKRDLQELAELQGYHATEVDRLKAELLAAEEVKLETHFLKGELQAAQLLTTTEIARLQAELLAAEEEYAAEASRLQAELLAAEEESAAEASRLQAELLAAQEESAAEKSRLQAELLALKVENDQLTGELAAAYKIRAENDRLKAELRIEAATLKSELMMLQEALEVTQVERKKNAAAAETAAAQAENERLKTELHVGSKRKDDHEKLVAENARLRNELHAAKMKASTMPANVEVLQGELAAADAIKSENVQLKAELLADQENKAENERFRAELLTENGRLKSKLVAAQALQIEVDLLKGNLSAAQHVHAENDRLNTAVAKASQQAALVAATHATQLAEAGRQSNLAAEAHAEEKADLEAKLVVKQDALDHFATELESIKNSKAELLSAPHDRTQESRRGEGGGRMGPVAIASVGDGDGCNDADVSNEGALEITAAAAAVATNATTGAELLKAELSAVIEERDALQVELKGAREELNASRQDTAEAAAALTLSQNVAVADALRAESEHRMAGEERVTIAYLAAAGSVGATVVFLGWMVLSKSNVPQGVFR